MKKISSVIFFSLFLTVCDGQTKPQDYSKIIIEQVEIMSQLLIKKDFDSFTKYSYPKLVEMIGGKQKMVEILEKGSKEMLSDGMDFLNVTFGKPSKIITTANELQCTVPQTIMMKVPKGKLVTKSTLIAISNDNGKTWYFVETAEKGIETMKKILPNLSEELVIPESKPPIFYAD